MSTKKQDKTKIVQIWGDILDEGFTSVPNILLRYRKNLKIKPKHLTLIIDIMSFKWDSESPYPSYSTLANRAGMDERSVKRTMQELEELGLLIRTPRFDKESGAQITTVFDFRPLVNRLSEEKKQTNKKNDKIVTGGVTEMSPGGMTKLSPGGVTEMSPKEYTNINNINFSNNPMEKFSKEGFLKKKEAIGVHKSLRNSIYRNRLFETFDNLNNQIPIEELVEEGSFKASKEILINRAGDLNKKGKNLDPNLIAKKVRKNFPYKKLPKETNNARKFFVAKICDITSQEILNSLVGSKKV
ncbi:MAG: hypothetical protein GTN99_11380 [Candidatus Dadabacteria bacterium]|nr:hypothetical protein [Candidatus Dadabacteria bacterium]NIT14802.1 hypothetical protein [Candidatus Dadabacteria bacterium]